MDVMFTFTTVHALRAVHTIRLTYALRQLAISSYVVLEH